MAFSLRRLLLGSPLRTERALHERLPIILALPIFASDALSSVSYATEAILRQFQAMHIRHEDYGHAMLISLGIVGLILTVVVSFWQIIRAYPQGGGSYEVARENLGLFLGLVVASALLVDYVLTVAVSAAESTAATFSAIGTFRPDLHNLHDYRLRVAVGMVLIIALLNLRGLRESGLVFSGPSYGFMTCIFVMIGGGLYRLATTGAPASPVAMDPNPSHDVALVPFLMLRAFASGCAALTGIEAVADGVQAFRHPEARNANITLGILGACLAVMFTGITFLAVQFGIGPRETETVVSQIARASFGTELPGGLMYYAVQVFTAAILFLAANTAFSGFPRLASILAKDGFLPRQLTNVGDRLVYSNGIVVLALVAILFLVTFGGETHALLPLYTVGVFIAFSLAQAGMVRRALRAPVRPWASLAITAVGCLVTTVVLAVILYGKFIVPRTLFGTTWFYEGAWMALTLMGLIIWMFYGINRHYQSLRAQLLAIPPDADRPFRHTVLVLVPASLHRGVVTALKYARSLSADAIGVHVALNPAEVPELRRAWEERAQDMPLVVLDSPYRSLVRPLMDYLDAVERVHGDDIVTVILPEFVPARWWHTFLHNASGWMLRLLLFYRKDVVIVSVRYYLDR